MRFFNPLDDVLIARARLPHWAQAGTVVFITWRTADSLPRTVLATWREDRARWLGARGISVATDAAWREKLQQLPPDELAVYHEHFTTRWHDSLDAGHGACVLRRPELSSVVAESLAHFDGDRYELHDFVIMPNHVHLLAIFPDAETQRAQCESWKRFTATRINRHLGATGRFWQAESFDHLVRHEAQFQLLRSYIRENPTKARLRPGEYRLK